MPIDTDEAKKVAIKSLKWSFYATLVVTFLCAAADLVCQIKDKVFICNTYEVGFENFMRLVFSYFVSSLLTMVSTFILQQFISQRVSFGEHKVSIGIDEDYTPFFFCGLIVYIFFYWAYLLFYTNIALTLIFILVTVLSIFSVHKLWIQNMGKELIMNKDGSNLPM